MTAVTSLQLVDYKLRGYDTAINLHAKMKVPITMDIPVYVMCKTSYIITTSFKTGQATTLQEIKKILKRYTRDTGSQKDKKYKNSKIKSMKQ